MPHGNLLVDFSYFRLPSCGTIAGCTLCFTNNLVNHANWIHLVHNEMEHLSVGRRNYFAGLVHIGAADHDTDPWSTHTQSHLLHHQMPSGYRPAHATWALNNLIIDLMHLDNVSSDDYTFNFINRNSIIKWVRMT